MHSFEAMSDPGGIELYLYWASDDLNKKPNFEVVAVPFIVGSEANALLVKGNFAQLQILNKYVNDDDLDKAMVGNPCSGYLVVYPGYVSKRMEPPKDGVKTYSVSWASIYIADEERSSFTITMHVDRVEVGDFDDTFWGRFG